MNTTEMYAKLTRNTLVGVKFYTMTMGNDYVICPDEGNDDCVRIYKGEAMKGKGGQWTKDEVYQNLAPDHNWTLISIPIIEVNNWKEEMTK